MVINNEDYQVIDFTEGIFQTNPVNIPDGFAEELENFIIHDGIVESRGAFNPVGTDFLSVSTVGWANTVGPNIPPIVVGLGIAAGANMKAAFVSSYPTSARPALVGITTNAAMINKIVPVATFNGPLVVYNQTLYAAATTGIIRVDVSNFPTSIVETLIPSSPNVTLGLVSHKSRLFSWSTSSNRINFTDAPAVGTLPETWNTGVNFIDVNGVGGVTHIWSMVSLGNYIFIFTNTGLFSLYTSGAPSNWVLKMVNPSIAISNQFSVVSRNSLIYYVTETGVYVTDGFEFKLLSQSLTDEFYGPKEITKAILVPFDGGLMLGTTNSQHTVLKLYHTKLNKIAWSSISIPPPETDIITRYNVVATGAAAWIDNPTALATVEVPRTAGASVYDTFVIPQGGPGTIKSYVIKYDPTTGPLDKVQFYIGNNPSVINESVAPLTFTTREIMDTNFMRTKKWQTGQLIVGGQKSTVITVGHFKNMNSNVGIPTALPVTSSPTPTNILFYSGYLLKFGILQHAYSLKLRVVLRQNNDNTLINSHLPLTVGPLGITSILESTTSRKGIRDQ